MAVIMDDDCDDWLIVIVVDYNMTVDFSGKWHQIFHNSELN